MTTRLPAGSLVITLARDGKTPHFEAKWREKGGRQHKRRLGKAWLDPSGDGWVKRAGRPPEGFLSREDAIVAMRAMISAHALQSAEVPQQTPSFSQVAEHWYSRAVRRQRKPMTLLAYRQGIDAYILGKTSDKRPSKRIKTPCPFVDKPIDEITRQDMRTWFDGIEHSRTKEWLHKLCKSICDYAISEQLMIENVVKSVDCRHVPYDNSYDFYSTEEIEKLIANAADDYDAALYATAAFTGLRKGELAALRWENIDFAHARVRVVSNLTLDKPGTPKNGKVRVVPLVPALAKRLKALKALGRNGIPPGAYVFANPERRSKHPWGNVRSAMRRYHKALERAGLRRLPFHSLRHSFGSSAVTVASLIQTRDWMGHNDVRTTSRYLHSKPLDSDADLLSAAFSA